MTEMEFIAILSKIKFAQRYYKLCAKYPGDPKNKTPKGSKNEILEVAKALNVTVTPDKNDRSFTLKEERIGKISWEGIFAIYNAGYIELMFGGRAEEGRKWIVGSNFAVLSNLVMKAKKPDHQNDPPFPRPHFENPEQLKAIFKEFILITRDIKEALRGKK